MIDSAILPEPGPDDTFFWEGLRMGKTLLQSCLECGRARFPASPRCTYCGSPRSKKIEASGSGLVYSWIVVHRGFHPAFNSSVPFVIATVDLDEGVRIVGELRSRKQSLKAGLRVRVGYEPIGELMKIYFAEAAAP